jgi:complex iron-sulfur molybdoenzyme family reductase subunit gamma
MRAVNKSDVEAERLLSPGSHIWKGIPRVTLNLTGTSLEMQPSPFVQANWKGRNTGVTTTVSIAAAHNGELLAFHLNWQDGSPNTDHGDNTRFPDAAAIALPLHENSLLLTMGAPDMGLNAWYWRANQEGGQQVLLEGPGSSRIVDTDQVRSGSNWSSGSWSVVIGRPLQVAEDPAVLQLAPGLQTRMGVAVWEGSRGERGGIKAYSQHWTELVLED